MSSDTALEKVCKEWREGAEALHLPRWEQLPEIDLYMDQVIAFMERHLSFFRHSADGNKIISPSIINNYVKMGIMPAPRRKRYGREHLAYLFILCSLKQSLSISGVSQIIKYQSLHGEIDSVYNGFCDTYERVFLNELLRFDEYLSAGDEPLSKRLRELSLSMAVYSNATQFITQDILSILGNADDAERTTACTNTQSDLRHSEKARPESKEKAAKQP